MMIMVIYIDITSSKVTKTILNSKFFAVDVRFKVLDSSFFSRWHLDFGFQSLVGLQLS